MIIGHRKIRIFQRFIISPAFEIILNILFIICFFILAFSFLKTGKYLNNYKLTEILDEEFNKEKFLSITTKEQFLKYIEFLVNRLYEFDPINNNGSFPYYIPFGSIRLRKYQNNGCSEFYNSLNKNPVKCLDENCTLEFLKSLNNNICYHKFNNNSKASFGKFEGKFSNYHLVNEGEFIDFNIDDYYSVENNNLRRLDEPQAIYDKEKIENFIMEEKSEIKFISLLFNVIFPVDKIYGSVICGIEMTNSRKEIENGYNIFNVSIFGTIEKMDILYISFHIIFLVTTIFNLLKMVFEIHAKFIFSIHISVFISEILNLLFTILLFLYYRELNQLPLINFNLDNFLNDEVLYSRNYIDFNYLLQLKGYIQIFISTIFMIVPMKILSLLSWYTTLFKPVVQYIGLITRLIGLFLVNLIFFFAINMTFFITYHHFYRNEISNFQSFYSSMINHFFIDSIYLIKNDKYWNGGNGINYGFFSSNYYLIINCILKCINIYFIIMIISSFVNSLDYATQYEVIKEENETSSNDNNNDENMKDVEIDPDINLNNLKKQILWLNLSNKTDVFNSLSEKTRKNLLFFTSSNQVISFLKYLFTLKPEMQFRNLKDKIGIVIHDNAYANSIIREEKLKNIYILLDWLNFVGCKIPILIYTQSLIEKNLKMKFSHLYQYISYSHILSVLEIFIKGSNDDDEEESDNDDYFNENYFYKNKYLRIDKVSSFTLYKNTYILNKKTKKSKSRKSDLTIRKRNIKFNTNCNLQNVQNIITNKLMKKKENTNSTIQNNEKEKDYKELKLNLHSFEDIDESN